YIYTVSYILIPLAKHTINYIVLVFFIIYPSPLTATLFPYTTLFRSYRSQSGYSGACRVRSACSGNPPAHGCLSLHWWRCTPAHRSEEHTSELQSRFDLVCRLLLEKKKINILDKVDRVNDFSPVVLCM